MLPQVKDRGRSQINYNRNFVFPELDWKVVAGIRDVFEYVSEGVCCGQRYVDGDPSWQFDSDTSGSRFSRLHT